MRTQIAVAVGILFAFNAIGSRLENPAMVHEEFERSYALAASGAVSLDNINGSVKVGVWDRDEVRIHAVKHASSRRELDDAAIVVDAHANSIRIRTCYGDRRRTTNRLASVEYQITVPRTARLDGFKLVNGPIDIEGVAGDVTASSVNGRVRAQRLGGEARLSTVNGSLEASFDRLDGSKTIQLQSVNGSIMLSIPHDARAEFEASSVSGAISNDFGLPVARGQFIGTHLGAVLRGGGTRIRLKSVNGAISIVPMAGGRRVRMT